MTFAPDNRARAAGFAVFAVLLPAAAASARPALVQDSVTLTGSHASNPFSFDPADVADAANNSVQSVNLTPGYRVRQIRFTGGTLTSVISTSFAAEVFYLLDGPALADPSNALGPLSPVGTYTTTPVVPLTYYVPGGFSSAGPLTFTAAESFNDGPGADSTSTATVAFDDSFGAGAFEYGGDTTNAPTFNRPDGLNFPGTNVVAYSAQRFTVDAPGLYTVASAQDFNGLILLYADQFDPDFPTANLFALSDDGVGVLRNSSFAPLDPDEGSNRTSRFDVTLLPGTTYTLVTTGEFSDSTGAFANVITGVGNVAVPEPSSAALLGLAGLAAVRRRRA